jgi:chaperone modulatory protein CbpM
VSYALVRTRAGTGPTVARQMDLDAFARAGGLHPDVVRRLVALGLLEPYQDRAGTLWFPTAQLLTLARIQRLRAGFSLNYAAVGLVIDLLDRVAELESALRQADRTRTRRTGG